MTKKTRCRVVAVVHLAIVALASRPALADDEIAPADVGAARALGQEGIKLAEAGNCAEAIDRFARAEKLFHAPTTLERLGECQLTVGRIVEGTENLNRVVRERLAETAPAPFVAAQERAKKLLAEARPKIARLKIAVASPPDAVLTVKIDSESVPLANLNTNRPVDPGEHVIEASAPGYLRATAHVRLPEGGVDSVALTLEADPTAVRAAAPPVVRAAAEEGPAPRRGSFVPAYVALGVGVAGIGVGSVMGLMAVGKKNDLDDACAKRVCAEAQRGDLDRAKTFGTVATIGFGVGALGLGVGTYLLLSQRSAPKAAARPRVTPLVGLGSAGLAGDF